MTSHRAALPSAVFLLSCCTSAVHLEFVVFRAKLFFVICLLQASFTGQTWGCKTVNIQFLSLAQSKLSMHHVYQL